MNADAIQIALGTLQGVLSSTAFVLFLFIGFCVVAGFTKDEEAGWRRQGVRSSRASTTSISQPADDLLRARRPAAKKVDQLHSPELLEAAARK